MAWIESHETLLHHPKTKRLARELGESIPSVIGRLHIFWWWALNYAQDGNITRYSDEDIADACIWEGDAKQFVEAMQKTGFIEFHHESGEILIHDWYEYAGRLIEQRRRNTESKRRSRERHRVVTVTSQGQERDGTGSQRSTIPNLTKPNNKEKEHVQPTSGYTPEFEKFWTTYPRRKEKQGAFKVWKTRLKEGANPNELILSAENYARECQRNGTEEKYIKLAATFLGPSKPYMDYLTQQVPEVEQAKEHEPYVDPFLKQYYGRS